MTIRHLLIVAVLVAAAAWAVTMAWPRHPHASDAPGPSHRAALPVFQGPDASTKPPLAAQALAPTSAGVPAWRASPASAPAQRSAADDQARAERQARMNEVKRVLDRLGPEDRQDPRKVSQALLDLEKANGSPELNGIRLDVLRQNLSVAAELQTLTTELQALRAEIPEGKQPPPALTERIKAKLTQIGAAQKRIRTDFMGPAVTVGAVASGH